MDLTAWTLTGSILVEDPAALAGQMEWIDPAVLCVWFLATFGVLFLTKVDFIEESCRLEKRSSP